MSDFRTKFDERQAQLHELHKELAAEAFLEGYIKGLRAYAWWKDGVEYVGTCGTTLKEAIERARGGLRQPKL